MISTFSTTHYIDDIVGNDGVHFPAPIETKSPQCFGFIGTSTSSVTDSIEVPIKPKHEDL